MTSARGADDADRGVLAGITISSSTASMRGCVGLLLDAVGLGQDAAVDREVALVGIFVAPVPLVAGDLDRHRRHPCALSP